MNESILPDSDETIELLNRARNGDRQGLDDLFSRHRERLRRMVDLRLARDLRDRVDASDVIQEAFLDAAKRLDSYLQERSMPFFLWLRFLTRQSLAALHRHHLGTKARDPRREVSLCLGPLPGATSEALAAQLLGQGSSPSEAVARSEMQLRLQEALNRLDPDEREVLALRHFEQLSNAEAARELGIAEPAASKRYIRALARMKGILAGLRINFGSRDEPLR
jgi:RNA polymerase sigma-70 factor (ECF subfamily)